VTESDLETTDKRRWHRLHHVVRHKYAMCTCGKVFVMVEGQIKGLDENER